jgi:hypothetical protein
MSDDKKVKDLLDKARAEGTLSAASAQAIDLVDPGATIQAALGVRVEDVTASEVLLVTMMPDDSGSISAAGNVDHVIAGHNLILDALAASKQRGEVLCHTRYLNGAILMPYRALDQAVRMDRSNYDACHGTPLYDESVVLLGTVLAKSQELHDAGVPVRTVTLLISDGADAGSRRARPADVRALVDDLRRAESHIVAAMGISDGSTDFRRVFREMGIEDRWILTPGSTASEIRRAFQVFSQSAIRAGQGAAILGGFTN